MKTALKITFLMISLNMMVLQASGPDGEGMILYTSDGDRHEGKLMSDSSKFITLLERDSSIQYIRKSKLLNYGPSPMPNFMPEFSYRGYGSKSETNLYAMASLRDFSLLLNYGTSAALLGNYSDGSDYYTHKYSSTSYSAFAGYTPSYGRFRFGMLAGMEMLVESKLRAAFFDNTNPSKMEVSTISNIAPTIRFDAYYYFTRYASAGVHINTYNYSLSSLPSASVMLEFKVKYYGLF